MRIFILVILFCLNIPLSAQSPSSDKYLKSSNDQIKKDPVLLKINGSEVYFSEFVNIYKKNRADKVESYDQKDVEEYLQLFINYKLKVKEAEGIGMDTAANFINEFKNYRKQLTKPYLTDKETTEILIKEAYERLKKEIKASHILIRVLPDANPKDTLLAYKKIIGIRDEILKTGNFEKAALENSQDESVKYNQGDLGYFTAFRMVYPFETAAYLTLVGQVSMPIRTQFGYHIIKVTNIREARGEILTAHIMVSAPKTSDAATVSLAKKKIDEVYEKVKSGEPFGKLAGQYSDDKNSGKRGGELPWFSAGRMVPEFEEAAFALKNIDDVAKPIKSDFGWHIIKLLGKKETGIFEEMQEEIKKKVDSDSRSNLSNEHFIKRIKVENKFAEFPKAKKEIIAILDSSLLEGRWNVEKAKNFSKPLFSLLDKNFTQQDFADYISKNQSRKNNVSLEKTIELLYAQFIEKTCYEFEDSRLEMKYPVFKALMDEYRDGILLFELTDQKVWTRAVRDTTGLMEYFNKNNSKYMWSERLDAAIYKCKNQDIAKNTRKMLKKKNTNQNILEELNKEIKNNVLIEEAKFQRNENSIIDSIVWSKGITNNFMTDSLVTFVVVNQKLPPQNKTLAEARGIAVSDYQNFLEKEWVAELRKKYKVEVNKETLSELK